MNARLKYAALILLAAFGTASCGWPPPGYSRIIPVPTTPDDMYLPKSGWIRDDRAFVLAQRCLEGKATGENIKNSASKFWLSTSRVFSVERVTQVGTDPNGKGKIYVLYFLEEEETPPPFG
jgi:hypothetical protein